MYNYVLATCRIFIEAMAAFHTNQEQTPAQCYESDTTGNSRRLQLETKPPTWQRATQLVLAESKNWASPKLVVNINAAM